jgi:hypothetical protein
VDYITDVTRKDNVVEDSTGVLVLLRELVVGIFEESGTLIQRFKLVSFRCGNFFWHKPDSLVVVGQC